MEMEAEAAAPWVVTPEGVVFIIPPPLIRPPAPESASTGPHRALPIPPAASLETGPEELRRQILRDLEEVLSAQPLHAPRSPIVYGSGTRAISVTVPASPRDERRRRVSLRNALAEFAEWHRRGG